MSEYIPTIGLEIHAELKTKTKMFCSSANNPEEARPNVNVCPICMAHPGTLPTINKEAVKHVLKVGKALGGKLADFSEFDRKNYFYPDIPKGYQISQYKYPLVSGGSLNGVAITRVHLEEDTAKSLHFDGRSESFVDFNRAGLPLMELVTEPVIHDAETAANFAKELQLLLWYLGVSDANMEKGQMRVEANISVSREAKFGTKVEVKNLNSFKSVARAIEYEVKRQIEALEKGETIVQETRGFDENTGKTFSQRVKETSQDYRYFPEPDLPKLKISEVAEFQNLELPELPWEVRKKYLDRGVPAQQVEVMVIDRKYFGRMGDLLLEMIPDKKILDTAMNFLVTDLAALVGVEDGSGVATEDVGGKHGRREYFLTREFLSDFAELMKMFVASEISSRGAKDILAIMVKEGGAPRAIAESKGLMQKSDEGELKKMAEEIIRENAKVAEEYKSGKVALLQFLVGQAMKKSGGAANPKMMADIFKGLLS